MAAEVLGEKYDQSAKRVWRNREILAPLLKACVEEFHNESIESIMKLIDADSISDDTPVSDLPPQVVEMATEMNSTTERPVTFDIKFVAKNPLLSTKDVLVRIHVILDFQNKFHPTDTDGKPYIIEDRGIYYVARGISSQLGPVTGKTNYKALEKVVSIWIVSENVPERLQETVSQYRFEKHDLIGSADIPKEHYDKMELVVVRRGKTGSFADPLFEYLDAVFRSDITTMNKFTPANDNPELVEEVKRMPGMGQMIYERGQLDGEQRGEQRGEQNAIVRSIRNLMTTMKWTAEQAMDALMISADQRPTYTELMNQTN